MATSKEIGDQAIAMAKTEGREEATKFLFQHIKQNPTDIVLIDTFINLAGTENGKKGMRLLLAYDPNNEVAKQQLQNLSGSTKPIANTSRRWIVPTFVGAIIGLVIGFIILNSNVSIFGPDREQLIIQARDEFIIACVQRFDEEQEDSSIQLEADFLQAICEESFDEEISPNEDAIVDCQQQISPLEDFSAWDRCMTSHLINSNDRFADPPTQDAELDLPATETPTAP